MATKKPPSLGPPPPDGDVHRGNDIIVSQVLLYGHRYNTGCLEII